MKELISQVQFVDGVKASPGFASGQLKTRLSRLLKEDQERALNEMHAHIRINPIVAFEFAQICYAEKKGQSVRSLFQAGYSIHNRSVYGSTAAGSLVEAQLLASDLMFVVSGRLIDLNQDQTVESVLTNIDVLNQKKLGLVDSVLWRSIGIIGKNNSLERNLKKCLVVLAAYVVIERVAVHCYEALNISARIFAFLEEAKKSSHEAQVRKDIDAIMIVHSENLKLAEDLCQWRNQSYASWVCSFVKSPKAVLQGPRTHLGVSTKKTL